MCSLKCSCPCWVSCNAKKQASFSYCFAISNVSFMTATKEHAFHIMFCLFKHQLYHILLLGILQSLKLAMSMPEIIWFGDGHYHCVIYGLGPYIADYEEQVLLSCVVQNWCPRYVIVALLIWLLNDIDILRCLSFQDQLDMDSLPHCQEHTEALIEEFDLDILWEQYGIISQLVVCFTLCCPYILTNKWKST